MINLFMDANATSESVCTKCGTKAGPGLIFCTNCGATLRPPLPLVAPAARSSHTHVPLIADAIGLILIAAQLTLVFWWLVPDDGTRLIVGIVAYGVLVAVALFLWYGKEAKRFSDAYEWVKLLFGSLLLGLMSFGIDVLIGSSEYPDISPIKAGTKVGSPFGFILTIFLCPGITMIAVASIARSFLVFGKEDPSAL
jgi:hypothetical protein